MAINPTDWPIDAYSVDGVELARRLNAVIPSEFNGKANLAGGNTFTGTQNFSNGTTSRLIGDMVNATRAYRTLFQSNVANNSTSVGAIPNGSGGGAMFTAYSSSNPDDTYCAEMAAYNSGEIQFKSYGLGSALSLYPIMRFVQNGRSGMMLQSNGALSLSNTAGSGVYGEIIYGAADGSHIRYEYTDGNNSRVHVSTAGAANMIMSDNGDLAIRGTLYVNTGVTPGSMMFTRIVDSTPNYTNRMTETASGIAVNLAYLTGVAATFAASVDNGMVCGWSLARWAAVYAVNGTIQTSDAREKTDVRELTAAEIAVAEELLDRVGMYQWLTDVAKDGDDAKWQVGLTAQYIDSVFKAHGLDSQRYGVILYEEFEAVTEEVDPETGVVVREARPYIDRWSASYAQLNQFLIRGLRAKQQRIEARLNALEGKSA